MHKQFVEKKKKKKEFEPPPKRQQLFVGHFTIKLKELQIYKQNYNLFLDYI